MAKTRAKNGAGAMGKDGQRPSLPKNGQPCTGMVPNETKRARLPKLGVHKASGQARVILSGIEHYCGPAGSVEAHERYAALVKEWLASGRRPMRQAVTVAAAVVTVRSLFDRFLEHVDASGRYWKNGQGTTQRQMYAWVRESMATALGDMPVAKLNEAALLRWRDVLERNRKRTRKGINRLVSAAVKVLRWGRPRGLVPKHVVADVMMIEPLKRGEAGDRPEHGRPRRAVSTEEAEKVALHACPQVAAMIRLQALCGMRPGEVCGMRWADIEKTPIPGDTTQSWLYTVPAGKTSHHGHATRYVLPPAAQQILERFPATPLAYIFSPAGAMTERRNRMREARKTPPTKQMRERDATAQHDYADRWTSNAYRHAVERACIAAGIQRFTPHELRHGFASWAANALSLGAAAAALNHTRVSTTERYVHVRHDDALAVAAAVQKRAGG